MKITIVLGAFLPVPPIMGGAVEKVWFLLGQEFAKRGHEVVQISRRSSQFPNDEVVAGVRHLRVRGFDTPRSLLWLKFLDLIYSIRTMSILPKSDIVVTNTFWLPILLRSTRRGCIYVHVARYPKGQMRFYGTASRLQAPSHAVARAIAQEAPRLSPKIKVVPYPAPESTTASAPPPVQQRENIILFVGRVHPEKGVHLLVDAFAGQARTVFADWKLMIVGPVEEKFGGGGENYLVDLRRRADPAGGRIDLHGSIFDPQALEQIFRRARLFVYPSLAERGESFGLAPLEAMAHGCAVLVSNLECFQDFIQDDQTGFVFDHCSTNPAENLRAKIDNVIADEMLLGRVAESGYGKAAEYSLERVASQFLDDFSSLVLNSHGAGTSR
jgi:glycosyltransferase involved in cell wall biosynthesis